MNDDNESAVVLLGGIAPLMDLVRTGSREGRTAAAATLQNLSTNDGNDDALVRAFS